MVRTNKGSLLLVSLWWPLPQAALTLAGPMEASVGRSSIQFLCCIKNNPTLSGLKQHPLVSSGSEAQKPGTVQLGPLPGVSQGCTVSASSILLSSSLLLAEFSSVRSGLRSRAEGQELDSTSW